jgi:protein-S-isoprenylcysteine O-methyltransferase Ste14
MPDPLTPMTDDARQPESGLRFAFLLLAFLGVFALIVFVPAGRIDWPAAWVWLGIMTIGLIAVRAHVMRVNPDLRNRRGRVGEGTAKWDRIVLAVFRLALLAAIVVAALDAGRFGWSHLPPAAAALGILLLGAGFLILGASMGSNPFFETTVRIQSEHQHSVSSAGPYRVIRHPGYVGIMLTVAGSVLLLGSAWALIPAALALVVMTLRTALEDRFLRRNLPGYQKYAEVVRFRLIPGVW